ncbi:protein of unknown function [Candidatus Methylocalor cossyra]|uniref:Uncharacterized protein n=1 Tax=Candidatus Methylocalor cossyra TaxID=3108543 RepID=A0ABM9NFE5_9GAMM
MATGLGGSEASACAAAGIGKPRFLTRTVDGIVVDNGGPVALPNAAMEPTYAESCLSDHGAGGDLPRRDG